MDRDQDKFYEDEEMESRENQPQAQREDEINDMKYFLELLKHIRAAINAGANVPLTGKKIIDAEKCLMIIDDMEKNLPDAVRVAHKTGTLDKLNVDIGIVYTRTKGDYILCLFYNGNMAENEADYNANDRGRVGDTYLADLSGALYRAYMED